MAIQNLLNAIKKEEEPNMSQMAPEDYESMQSTVTQDMLYSTPKLSDVLPEKKEPILPENYNQLAQEEALNQIDSEITKSVQKQPLSSNIPIQDTSKSIPLKTDETELQKLERKLQELRDLDLARQETASKYNFGTKAAAIIGDALSRYQTGAIQKNVGVPVQFTGPSLQQLMEVVGEVKPPSTAEQRQNLIDRYKELKAEQLAKDATEREKQAADTKYKRDLDMLYAKLASDERIAARKAAQPTFEEKKQIEADVKEQKVIAKENRAIKEKLKPAIDNLNTEIEKIDEAIKLFKDKSGKTKKDLTGPILGYFPTISDDRQLVEKALNQISLKEMTKTFEGMASAVNSNVEREFFQAAQPSMRNSETVNLATLEAMKTNLKSLREKSKAKLQEIEGSKESQAPYGEFAEMDGKQYKWNPSVNKYQLIQSK